MRGVGLVDEHGGVQFRQHEAALEPEHGLDDRQVAGRQPAVRAIRGRSAARRRSAGEHRRRHRAGLVQRAVEAEAAAELDREQLGGRAEHADDLLGERADLLGRLLLCGCDDVGGRGGEGLGHGGSLRCVRAGGCAARSVIQRRCRDGANRRFRPTCRGRNRRARDIRSPPFAACSPPFAERAAAALSGGRGVHVRRDPRVGGARAAVRARCAAPTRPPQCVRGRRASCGCSRCGGARCASRARGARRSRHRSRRARRDAAPLALAFGEARGGAPPGPRCRLPGRRGGGHPLDGRAEERKRLAHDRIGVRRYGKWSSPSSADRSGALRIASRAPCRARTGSPGRHAGAARTSVPARRRGDPWSRSRTPRATRRARPRARRSAAATPRTRHARRRSRRAGTGRRAPGSRAPSAGRRSRAWSRGPPAGRGRRRGRTFRRARVVRRARGAGPRTTRRLRRPRTRRTARSCQSPLRQRGPRASRAPRRACARASRRDRRLRRLDGCSG